MATNTARTFTDLPAVRTRVPLLIGIMGPSGGGKTYSALRLATGIARSSGGEIFVIDTESRRSLHYADSFKFRHVPFGSPFSPDDYLQAFEYCKERGAGVVVVDSMSHEHEGPGGVLEWHASEIERLSKGDSDKAESMKFLAWSAPKQARRRLLNSLLQMDMHVIFCFRAKEKLKIERGKKPGDMGWMPIAGEDFLFEMTVNFLLPPAANGVPQWDDLTPEQRVFLKAPPKHFRSLLEDRRPLDEGIGEAMAKWAAGAPTAARAAKDDVKALITTLTEAGLGTGELRKAWIEKQVGHAIVTAAELTPDECAACMATAKEGV